MTDEQYNAKLILRRVLTSIDLFAVLKAILWTQRFSLVTETPTSQIWPSEKALPCLEIG